MSASLVVLLFQTVGRTSWTLADTVLHLVDNALDADARHVWVSLYPESACVNTGSLVVADDGHGMDAAGITRALALGSGELSPYRHGAFGLGMKVAASARGERLEIVSSVGGGFVKRTVRLDEARTQGRYVAVDEPLSETDTILIRTFLPGNRGTLVRVGTLTPELTEENLKLQRSVVWRAAGLTYGRLIGDGLTLQVNGADVPATDPLRTREADQNEEGEPERDYHSTYRWLEPSNRLCLASEPPLWGSLTATRRYASGVPFGFKRWLDSPEHDGLYIYRNRRLIAGPLRPEGLPTDEEGGLRGLRVRLDVSPSADAVLGLTLAKNTATLPDNAGEALVRLVSRLLDRDNRAATVERQ